MKKLIIVLWSIVAVLFLMSTYGGFTVKSARNPKGTLDPDGNLRSVTVFHLHVHEGNAWAIRHAASIANKGGTLDMTFLPVTKEAHIMIGSYSSTVCTFLIYEGVTSTGGTAVTAYGMNRVTASNHLASLAFGPTISNIGKLMFSTVIASNSSNSNRSVFLHEDGEYILKPGTKYLLRLVSSDSAYADVAMSWYEED